MMKKQPQVCLNLVGIDGNAFAILGAFQKAARQQGVAKTEVDEVVKEATSGDYNHLLVTIMEHTYTEDGEEENF